jgi:hypothetical protein
LPHGRTAAHRINTLIPGNDARALSATGNQVNV